MTLAAAPESHDDEASGGEPPIDPRDLMSDRLYAFTVFARHLNFQKAADELMIAQPAAHRKIKKLEATLGMSLYVSDPRSKKILRLTSQGLRLVAYGEDALCLARDASADLRSGRPCPLTIAAGRGAFLHVVDDAMRNLSTRVGGLCMITARNDRAIELVRQGQTDVSIIGFIDPPTDFHYRALGSYRQVLVVSRSHHLAGRSEITLADLDGLSLALPEQGERLRDQLISRFTDEGVTTRVVAEAADWDLLVQFVTYGVEATIVNDLGPLPDDLTSVPLVDLPIVTYHAIWRDERHPKADELISMHLGTS